LVPAVCSNYPEVDKDLLNTGVILHDIGKIKEYQYDVRIDMADEGRFLGHIILGIEMVNEKITEIDNFPEELRLKLLHMIASHHGHYEWQSPKIPKFLEACLLHHLDLLDGEAYKFINVNKDSTNNWTWSKTLNRWVYTPVEQDEEEKNEDDFIPFPPY
jgi:3'-5' exoribonuclease